MDINDFLRRRKPRWDRLTRLLDRVDQRGLESLSPPDVDELFALYRLVSSDVNLVQTRTGNPALLEYLEGLVGRAYANLAVPKDAHPFRAWWRILRHRFPAVVRAEKRLVLLAALALLAGTAFGFGATLASPRRAEVFLPGEHLTERPSERVAELERMEREGKTRVETASTHANFTTFLLTHNIRVTVFAFALGFTFGVGTLVLLFYNGAMLGSLAALYLDDGVMTFFVAWVGPHGAIELPCVVLGAMAGLMLARAQFRRDTGPLLAQLRAMRPALVDVLVGVATFLVLAGVVEGGLSQVNEPTIPYRLKIAVAAVLFGAFMAYLFWMPVRPDSLDSSPRAVPPQPSKGPF
jgi:uncharacterized membrane protein SpoIIM required for sporulation